MISNWDGYGFDLHWILIDEIRISGKKYYVVHLIKDESFALKHQNKTRTCWSWKKQLHDDQSNKIETSSCENEMKEAQTTAKHIYLIREECQSSIRSLRCESPFYEINIKWLKRTEKSIERLKIHRIWASKNANVVGDNVNKFDTFRMNIGFRYAFHPAFFHKHSPKLKYKPQPVRKLIKFSTKSLDH